MILPPKRSLQGPLCRIRCVNPAEMISSIDRPRLHRNIEPTGFVIKDGAKTKSRHPTMTSQNRRHLRSKGTWESRTRDDSEIGTVRDAIRRFREDVVTGDHHRLEETMRAVGRLECWAQATAHFSDGPEPDTEKAGVLLSFWFTYGLQSIPAGLKEDLVCLVDAFRKLLPPYRGVGSVLYRGELASRHAQGVYGISWTPNIEAAQRFSRRRSLLGEGAGVVLKIEASPNMIVAAVRDLSSHTLTLEEDEYILDPRRLVGKIHEVS